MPSLPVKKDDMVMIITGKDRGKTGKILKVFPKQNRVIVEGLNRVKRHTRPRRNQQGGILEMEAPLHVSNVMLLCPSCNRPTRTGKKILEGGRKVRICRKCLEIVDKG
jgi:large subunit ribosomal protein L24